MRWMGLVYGSLVSPVGWGEARTPTIYDAVVIYIQRNMPPRINGFHDILVRYHIGVRPSPQPTVLKIEGWYITYGHDYKLKTMLWLSAPLSKENIQDVLSLGITERCASCLSTPYNPHINLMAVVAWDRVRNNLSNLEVRL